MIENINLFFVFADLIERFMKVQAVEASNQIFFYQVCKIINFYLAVTVYCYSVTKVYIQIKICKILQPFSRSKSV